MRTGPDRPLRATGPLGGRPPERGRPRGGDPGRESEERFRRVFEDSAIGMALEGLDGRYLRVNRTLAKLLGYTEAELLATSWRAVTHPDDVAGDLEQDRRMLAGAIKSYQREKRYVDRHGRPIWVLLSVSLVRDAAGCPLYFVSQAQDITARRAAQETLVHQAQLTALKADVSQVLARGDEVSPTLQRCAEAFVHHLGAVLARIWTLEPGAGVLELQASAGLYTHLDGAHSRVPVGQLKIGLIAAERRPHMTNALPDDPHVDDADWVRREELVAFAGYPLLVEGRVVGVAAMFARQPLAPSALVGLASVADEIAQYVARKRAEATLAERETLLQQIQKMEAVGRLAGGIAHDFNNLLTVIRGRAAILLHRLAPEDPAHRHITLIEKTAERAAALTQQLLSFTRKRPLEPRVVSLNDVVVGIEKMLRRLIGEHIHLVTVLDPGLGHTKADPIQIEQVILNMVVNARDAMPQGGRLTIETANVELDEAYAATHPGARPGRYVGLAVADTGTGMDEETRARVFEPFFTTKDPGRGTGLGLATVYGIVKQSAGYVWVESAPGRGARFTVYLPRETGSPASETPPAEARRPPATGSETVLLVEDEAGVRDLAREVLESHGYRVLIARDPGEALLMGERHPGPIDVVVTDVVMPLMNGRELGVRLMSMRPDLRLVYMSGQQVDPLVDEALLRSTGPLLTKPFAPGALAGAVRQVLDAARGPDPR